MGVGGWERTGVGNTGGDKEFRLQIAAFLSKRFTNILTAGVPLCEKAQRNLFKGDRSCMKDVLYSDATQKNTACLF